MVLILFQYPQFSWAGKIIPIKGWWMRGRMEGTGGVQVGRAHRSQPWPWPPPGWASSTVPHLTMDSTRAQERQGTPVTSTTICQTIPGSIHSKPIPRVIPIISHCSHHFPRRSGGLSKEPMVRWCHTKRDVSKNSFKLSIGRLGFFTHPMLFNWIIASISDPLKCTPKDLN